MASKGKDFGRMKKLGKFWIWKEAEKVRYEKRFENSDIEKKFVVIQTWKNAKFGYAKKMWKFRCGKNAKFGYSRLSK
jgi:hypothetical protein